MAAVQATRVPGFGGAVWDCINAVAATVLQTTGTIPVPRWAKGCYLVVDVTAGATLVLIPELFLLDPVSGKSVQLFGATAALTGVGTAAYIIHPAPPAATDDVTETEADIIGGAVIVQVTHGNANAATYKCSLIFLR